MVKNLNYFFLNLLRMCSICFPAASRPPSPNDSAIATATAPRISPNAKFTIESANPILLREIAKNNPKTETLATLPKKSSSPLLNALYARLAMNPPTAIITRPKAIFPDNPSTSFNILLKGAKPNSSTAGSRPKNIKKKKTKFPNNFDKEVEPNAEKLDAPNLDGMESAPKPSNKSINRGFKKFAIRYVTAMITPAKTIFGSAFEN